MPRRPSGNLWGVLALLAASLLVMLRDLANPQTLPPQALAWTAVAALGYLALLPLCWRGYRLAPVAAALLATASIIVTSLNPVDPYYLTHWDNPVESMLVVLEGYALPLPLIFFATRAYLERRRRAASGLPGSE